MRRARARMRARPADRQGAKLRAASVQAGEPAANAGPGEAASGQDVPLFYARAHSGRLRRRRLAARASPCTGREAIRAQGRERGRPSSQRSPLFPARPAARTALGRKMPASRLPPHIPSRLLPAMIDARSFRRTTRSDPARITGGGQGHDGMPIGPYGDVTTAKKDSRLFANNTAWYD